MRSQGTDQSTPTSEPRNPICSRFGCLFIGVRCVPCWSKHIGELSASIGGCHHRSLGRRHQTNASGDRRARASIERAAAVFDRKGCANKRLHSQCARCNVEVLGFLCALLSHHDLVRVLMQIASNPLRPGTRVMPYIPGHSPMPFAMQPVVPPEVAFAPPPFAAPAPDWHAPMATQCIVVPSAACGVLLGHHGSVLRELR